MDEKEFKDKLEKLEKEARSTNNLQQIKILEEFKEKFSRLEKKKEKAKETVCDKYWKDFSKIESIDINNIKEIEDIKNCLFNFFDELFKNAIITSHYKDEKFHEEYIKIINKFTGKNILNNLNELVNKYKIKFDFTTLKPGGKDFSMFIDLISSKITESKKNKIIKNILMSKIKPALHKRLHEKKYTPVLYEFLEREAPHLRELEEFKTKTGYIDYSDLDGISKKRRKSKSIKRRKSKSIKRRKSKRCKSISKRCKSISKRCKSNKRDKSISKRRRLILV